MKGKVTSLQHAVGRFIQDGCSVALCLALEHAVPFAAVHEMIRQGKRNLTLIGPISDAAFDQLIGAGCVSKVMAAWVGNVSHGMGYCFSRAYEEGIIKVVDYSNLSIASAILAAALGIPFIPSKTLIGSDILEGLVSEGLAKLSKCPFTGENVVLLKAVKPEVSLIHVQRCDDKGYAQMWGNLGIVREACQAADKVIVTAEEVVDHETITHDPNSVICPPYKVAAVCQVKYGAHPSPLAGYYNRDHSCFREYHEMSRTRVGFKRWLEKWVLTPGGRGDYLRMVDSERIRVAKPLKAGERMYGY
ncbi:MAG: CoA-transferase [Candidatus Caldarchaeum sp.]